MSNWPTRGLPILMYHKIGKRPEGALVPHHYVGTARFERHVKALTVFGFKTTRLDALTNSHARLEKAISLTFDDGYQNFATEAAPVLAKYQQTATVFIVTSLIGLDNAWDIAIGDKPEALMDAETLVQLANEGIEFGSHSVSHARLGEVDQNVALVEITESKKVLTDLLSKPVEVFCYPYGSHNEGVRKQVEGSGYKLACSVEKGWNHQTTDPYRLKRINVRSDTSTPILFWKLWRQSRIGSNAS